MEQSVQLIREAGSLDADSAQGTIETLVSLGVGTLQSAELVSNDTGVVLQVQDDKGDTYYLGYGAFGYLEIVRKDSLDGEIIYAPAE